MYEFKLPDVGEGIHEAEILTWLVQPGDTVTQDQPLLEVQTDKAVVEIPSPVAGQIADIRAEVGTLAEVGDILVVIATEEPHNVTSPTGNGQTTQAEPAPRSVKSPGLAGPDRRVLAAPAVRKMALERGIELADVSGSGPAGRVLPQDLDRYVEQQQAAAVAESTPEVGAKAAPPSPPPVVPPAAGQERTDEEPLQGLRRRVAERMALAWQIPHVTSFEEIEADRLVALRDHLQPEAERRGVKLTYLPLIIKAAVQCLKAFPYFNASLDMERRKILVHRHYHIGVATAIPEGLLVPVIRHADRLSVLQIAQEIKRLADAAPTRTLTQVELSGSTFSVTNFGSFGGRQGTPIINPPEVAILGIGRLEEKPVAVEGQVVIRPMLPLALSYDHRLIDGAAAGAFIQKLSGLLSDPQQLLLDLV